MQAVDFFADRLQHGAVFRECAHPGKGIRCDNHMNVGLRAHIFVRESGFMFRRAAMPCVQMGLILDVQLRRSEPCGQFSLDCLCQYAHLVRSPVFTL